jgi:hypothetical protein
VFQPLARQTVRVLTRQLCLSVLLLAAQAAYPQSVGPEFPNPGNAHMSRENQHTLGLQVASQVYQQMPVLPDNSQFGPP